MGCVWDMSKVVFVLSIGSSRYPLARPVWRPRMIPTPSTITPTVPCFPLPLWPPPPPSSPLVWPRIRSDTRYCFGFGSNAHVRVVPPLYLHIFARWSCVITAPPSPSPSPSRVKSLPSLPSLPSLLFSSLLLYLYLCGPFLSALPCAKRGNPTCVVRRTFYHY